MNTSALKTFAQETRKKLVSSIKTRMNYILTEDTAELRGKQNEINTLRKEIAAKGENNVVEEVTYTWFNRVMALRFMDANGYNVPMVITPAAGQIRPEILQEAMGGNIDEDLGISLDILRKDEEEIYHDLLIAICNQYNNSMPFLFESISDYTELLLPTDLLSEQSFVTDIRKGMTDEDCQNVEIMGWLYQFYITERKADAEAKKSQKGGLKSDEQAAATQLFTPHWIVRYMVENTLGRIWTTLHPDTALKAEMPYYIEPADNQPDPIPEDIQSVKDIRFIDPCMGSGHVLVYAFDLLCKMYEEEGYRTKEIPALILENNLYGMDIDKRCYQLASFALTMKANAYYSRYLRRKPVEPNVIFLENIDHETIAASGDWDEKSLIWQFENIDTIGALLKVTPEECEAIEIGNNLFGENAQKLKREAKYLSRGYHCVVTNPPYLGKGMGDILKVYVGKEYPNTKGDIMATFMERGMELCTNKGKMGMINQDSWMFTSSYEGYRTSLFYSNIHIDSLIHLGPHAFAEISGEIVKTTTFIFSKNCISSKGCYINVYDLNSYKEKENETLLAIKNNDSKRFFIASQKDFTYIEGTPICFWGKEKLYNIYKENKSLSQVCLAKQGLATGNNDRFLRVWFEVSKLVIGTNIDGTETAHNSGKKWFPYNKGGGTKARRWSGNISLIVNWENDGYEIKNITDEKGKQKSRPQNTGFYFKPSISWGLISGPLFRYFPQGFIYDVQGMSCFFEYTHIYKELAWLNSKVFNEVSKLISPAGHIQIGEIGKMPACDNCPEGSSELAKQNISISKSDWNAHETSWDFTSNELLSIDLDSYGSIMHNYAEYHQISIDQEPAELNKLSWRVDVYKKKWETMFLRLHQNEEKLNEKFIHIYGLEDELTPDVPLDEVTILQQGEISIEKENMEDGSKEDEKIIWHDDVIIKQFISYLVGCFMGRYSVDKPGLIIANQHQDLSSLDLQVDGIENSPRSTLSIDDDGIVPIIQESDFFADDMTERIQLAIKTLFGEEQYYENMKYIEQTIGKSLRDYLYKDYYADHQQMYSVKGAKRPIYWLFSSRMGDKHKKGYFKALVYMHRMEADTLSKLHAEYVHPYINKVEQQLREAEEETLRDDQTQAQRNRALKLVNELKEKVKEVKEFEQELVEMASHRLTIDLDDGVKANYPKFYPLVEPIKGLECEKK